MSGQDTGCGLEGGARTLSDVRAGPAGVRAAGGGALTCSSGPSRAGAPRSAGPPAAPGRPSPPPTWHCRNCHLPRARVSAACVRAWVCARTPGDTGRLPGGGAALGVLWGPPLLTVPLHSSGATLCPVPQGFMADPPPTWTRTPCSQRGSSHLWAEPPGRCLRTDQAQGQPRWAGGGPGPSACH